MNRILTASLALCLGALPGSAFAACQQQGALICGSGAPSVASQGGVQVSRGGSFQSLAPSRPLRTGDRFLAGADEATLSLGPSCSAVVEARTLVTLTRSGGQTCARMTAAPDTTFTQGSLSRAGALPTSTVPTTTVVPVTSTGLIGGVSAGTAVAVAGGIGVAAAIGVGVSEGTSGGSSNLARNLLLVSLQNTPPTTVSAK